MEGLGTVRRTRPKQSIGAAESEPVSGGRSLNVNGFKYCPYLWRDAFRACGVCRRTLFSLSPPNVCVFIWDQAIQQILLAKERKNDSEYEPNWELPGGSRI